MNHGADCNSGDKEAPGTSLAAGIRQFYETNGLVFGSVDIFCLGSSTLAFRVLALVHTLLCFDDAEGRSPITHFVVVLPAAAADEAGSEQAIRSRLERLLATSDRAFATEVPADDRIQIVTLPNLRSETVLSVVATTSPRSVVIIVNAAALRTEGVQPFVPSGAGAPALLEDFWVPHLHALGQALMDLMKEREIYAILDAGQVSPYRPALNALLKSIEGVGLVGSQIENDPNAILAGKTEDWNNWLAEGRLGAVLKSIDTLPSALDAEKPFLRIQVLHRAGLHGQALDEIERHLKSSNEPNPLALVGLARIATDAGAAVLSSRLLGRAVGDLDTIEALESALAVADDIDDRALQEMIAARLDRLFPGSATLRRRRAHTLVAVRDYRMAAMTLASDPAASGTAEFYTLLADALSGPGVPDYVGIRLRLSADNPSWAAEAHTAVVRDALARGLVVHALDLVISETTSREPAQRDAKLVLDVIERLLLDRDHSGKLAVAEDRLKEAVKQVVCYLSGHPIDGSVRLRLTRLLSVEASGLFGLSLIASATLDFMRRPLALFRKAAIRGIPIDKFFDRRDFVERALKWLGSESPTVLGRLALPKALLTDPPDDLAATIADFLLPFSAELEDDDDVKALLNWLSLGVSIAPHTSDPDQDLTMIRRTAGGLAVFGRTQLARDLAEQALQNSGTTPRRIRMAWFVMADTYHRIGNNLESLIALSCAAAGDINVEANEAWHEFDTLVRLLRDIGLFAPARRTVVTASRLLHLMGVAELNQHRVQLMKLHIEMAELRTDPARMGRALPDLLSQVLANARDTLGRNDNPTPVAVMLGQLLRIAAEIGVPTPDNASAMLAELQGRAGTATSSIVRAMSSKHPSAADVLLLHKRTERARYSDDVAYDARLGAVAAERLLCSDEALRDPRVAAFAIELLSDRAIAMPGWETTARPPPPIDTTDEPSTIAKSIATQGVTILMAGLDADGRLVRVIAVAGRVDAAVRENENVFSGERFHAWANEFPYRYGIDETTSNLFHVSTEGLCVSTLPEGRVVLITSTELQQLPPNLLRIGDTFAGESRAMASAPSLSWLAAARSGDAVTRENRAAWISTDEKYGSTLAMIANRLTDTFAKHGITLDTGSTLPEGLAGSELVIVAAHGSISPEGRYFHRVANDADLNVVGAELAAALRNVGVVILFVCSGGRADKHPAANTTIGMAKQLLDRGCSAVISSPWPLDARVTYHWLPAFLDAWKCGSPVIDANFRANAAVAEALGPNPANYLAMTVYGDALRTAGTR